eukprot:328834-Pyramimonas_sp.AAC.1
MATPRCRRNTCVQLLFCGPCSATGCAISFSFHASARASRVAGLGELAGGRGEKKKHRAELVNVEPHKLATVREKKIE